MFMMRMIKTPDKEVRRVTRTITKGFLVCSLLAGCAAYAAAPPPEERHARRNSAQVKTSNADRIILDSTASILISPDEPGPVATAATDLANDMAKVFGKLPKIVNRVEDAGVVTILVGEQSKLSQAMRHTALVDPESFSISIGAVEDEGLSPSKVVVLSGADMRGTIYAIYEFSQAFLDIDPMYYWTDREPTRRAKIALPASLNKVFPSPLFRYRGIFVNDEDLLTGWAPGEKQDGTGISLTVWNKIFETILRLKGNIVAPGTWIFPDDSQVKLAGKRGLIITQHHATPLGLNVARWPADVPYSYVHHSEILERAWKNAAATYSPDQEVLWTVGLRGLGDASYDDVESSVRGNDKALGALITKAIADQISIVRSIRSDAQFIIPLWNEGAGLVKGGYIEIPPEVGRVWPDDGYGELQDGGQVRAAEGAYYHVAMMNFSANQLSEIVPIERVESELGRYINAGATNYLLLNTSDIRPVAMMAKAVMNVGWKGLDATGAGFYSEWSSEEFGKTAAPVIANLYKEYFKAPAHLSYGGLQREYGDQYYHAVASLMLLSYMNGPPVYGVFGSATPIVFPYDDVQSSTDEWLPKAIKTEIRRCDEAQPRWDTLWKHALDAEPLVLPARRPFYHAQVLAMIEINRESNRILSLVAQAVGEARAGRKSQARTAAEQTFPAFDAIKMAEANAEYGKWSNWFRGDWLTGIDRTRELVRDFLKYLDNPFSRVPPPVLWTDREAYQHIMRYEGDRKADVK